MKSLFRFGIIFCLVSLGLVSQCAQGVEEAPVAWDERAFEQAEIMAEHGDLNGALSVLLQLMRQDKDEELREEAQGHLRNLGLTSRDLLKLEPSGFKKGPNNDAKNDAQKLKRNELLKRIATKRITIRLQQLHVNQGLQLLRMGVSPWINSEGSVQFEINKKSIVAGLGLLIEVGMSDSQDHPSRQAQRFLEKIRLVGERLEMVQKACESNELPDELLQDLVARILIHRLAQYRMRFEMPNEDDGEGEGEGEGGNANARILERKLAAQMGRAIYQGLLKSYSKTKAFQESQKKLTYWNVMGDQKKGKDPEF